MGLQKVHNDIEISHSEQVNWATLKKADVVFVQRPSSSHYVQIIEMAKLNGKKIWIDYDDDLFSVPESNVTSKLYNAKDTKESIIKCLRLADLVTVSAASLKETYGTYNTNVKVVPNAYDKVLFSYRKEKLEPRNKIIFWRGSETHDEDLLEVTSELVKTAIKFPDYQWVFIGSPFWHTIQELVKRKIKVIKIPAMEPICYFKTIYEMRPAIQIVPLTDNKFNHGKSNIAWIEGTHAGAQVIAPDLPEWDRPGICLYRSGEIGNEIEGAMNPAAREKFTSESWQFINSDLTLDKVNDLRREYLLRIL